MSAPATPSIPDRLRAAIAELESILFAIEQQNIPPAGTPPITAKKR